MHHVAIWGFCGVGRGGGPADSGPAMRPPHRTLSCSPSHVLVAPSFRLGQSKRFLRDAPDSVQNGSPATRPIPGVSLPGRRRGGGCHLTRPLTVVSVMAWRPQGPREHRSWGGSGGGRWGGFRAVWSSPGRSGKLRPRGDIAFGGSSPLLNPIRPYSPHPREAGQHSAGQQWGWQPHIPEPQDHVRPSPGSASPCTTTSLLACAEQLRLGDRGRCA